MKKSAHAHKDLVFLLAGILLLVAVSRCHADASDLIRTTLKEIDHVIPFSEDAVAFLELTACAETLNGRYLGDQHSVDRGIFQINRHTEKWMRSSYLPRKGWLGLVDSYREGANPLHNNLRYQIILARFILWTIPEKLRDKNDVLGMAVYWKKYWNTEEGAGTIIGAFDKYLKFKSD